MKSVKPKKHLGQHFLTDLGIARRIADTVDACPEIPVLEIGPGMGVLTQYLVEKPREVKAVEIDKESVAYLYDRFPKLRDNIIGDDFLRMDLTTLFDGRPFVLTGNYPYDISSQIFFKMLDNKELIPCCTGMIQREVALRMAAAPGSKAYGILSVLTQAWYDVEYLFTVDETVFNPPPKVKSAVIRMTRNGVQELGCDERLFKRLVKAVFNQRRKMLRVSLRQLFQGQRPEDGFFQRDIMTKRPEQLNRIPGLIMAELLRTGSLTGHTIDDAQPAIFPVNLTQTDRTRQKSAAIVAVHGNELSRYSLLCDLVCLKPHTVNIISDFFLTDDDRCLFKFFCHLCTSSLFHSLNYFTFLLQMFASVALNMVCSYASAS